MASYTEKKSPYEKARDANIRRNTELLRKLGINMEINRPTFQQIKEDSTSESETESDPDWDPSEETRTENKQTRKQTPFVAGSAAHKQCEEKRESTKIKLDSSDITTEDCYIYCEKCDDMHFGDCPQKDKPFKCTQCSSTFRIKGHLTRHTQIHTGEKPYQCLTCNRRFRQLTNLTTHMLTHTGEKPYECSTCKKRFPNSSVRIRHEKTHKS